MCVPVVGISFLVGWGFVNHGPPFICDLSAPCSLINRVGRLRKLN